MILFYASYKSIHLLYIYILIKLNKNFMKKVILGNNYLSWFMRENTWILKYFKIYEDEIHFSIFFQICNSKPIFPNFF